MEQSVSTNNAVRKEQTKTKITVEKITKAEFQKEGTMTAQIRQDIVTHSFYPSKKTSSSMQANVFSNDDFGFKEQKFTSTEHRVAWIPVPPSIKLEEVQARLDEAFKSGACLYRVLSNEPILDENQKYAISQGMKTKDSFANSQALRYPETDETIANGTANKLVLDAQGRVQYRKVYFWKTPMADVDLRGNEVYLSAELKAELNGAAALQGQTI